MSNKDRILDLYYNEHLKQKEIADIVGTSAQYVSKVVRADKRNKKEKECREQTNSEKRKIYMQNYFQNYDRPKKGDNSYEQMLAQQKQDSIELSFSNNIISDYSFAKWNRGMYNYDKNSSDLVQKRNIVVTFDVPKRVRNVINPVKRRVLC